MDKERDFNHSISHRIYIVLHHHDVCCLITDKNKKPLLLDQWEWLDEGLLLDILKSKKYFQEIYSSSRLILSESKYSLIPSSFHLSDDENEMIFAMNHRLKPDERLLELETDEKITVLAAPFEELYRPLSTAFPGIRVRHHLHYFLRDPRILHQKGEQLLVSLTGEDLTVIAKRNQDLILANTYLVKNQEEFRYFVMLVTDQCEMDTGTCKLYLWGQLDKEWFKDYFTEIQVMEGADGLLFGLTKEESDILRNFPVLQSALLCES